MNHRELERKLIALGCRMESRKKHILVRHPETDEVMTTLSRGDGKGGHGRSLVNKAKDLRKFGIYL